MKLTNGLFGDAKNKLNYVPSHMRYFSGDYVHGRSPFLPNIKAKNPENGAKPQAFDSVASSIQAIVKNTEPKDMHPGPKKIRNTRPLLQSNYA